MTLLSMGRRRFSSPPAWTVVDAFARELRSRGAFPPPLGRVRVLLEEQDVGGQFRKVDPPIELDYERSPGGVLVLAMTSVKRRHDEPRRSIPEGRYRFRLESDFYQEEVFVATLGDGARLPQPLDLLPGAAYPFPLGSRGQGVSATSLLRGTVREPSGAAVVNAVVTVIVPGNAWPFRQCRTDRTGQWVIVIPDAAFPAQPDSSIQASVRVALPNAASIDLPNVTVRRGRDSALTQTAMRGFVLNTKGHPLPGATIAVAGETTTVKSGASGEWFLYFAFDRAAGPVAVTATLPDGRSQTQAQPIVIRAMTVVPTFRFA